MLEIKEMNMSQPDYPVLDEGGIRIVLKRLADDANYLNNPECPYTDETKSLFLGSSSTETEGIVNNIERQIAVLDKLNAQLEKQSNRFDNGELEPSEANAYFRQRINIAREILELQEKLAHVQNVESFYAKVMEIMEDVLDVDQRADAIKQLQDVIDKEG